MQNTGLKVWKPKTHLLHNSFSRVHTRYILKLVSGWRHFSSTHLSQDFKASNGGPMSKKIPAKINRCLFKIELKTWVS